MIDLVRTLRKKCPWDRKQTLATLKNTIIEESYELIDAIEKNDPAAIAEEIGDVIFLGIFFALIYEEEKKVRLARLFGDTVKKYKDKHPHVFGRTKKRSVAEVLDYWQRGKKDRFEGIPTKLPALMAARIIQERAARTGFDWRTRAGPIKKIKEELREIRAARGRRAITGEMGDLLFSCVNLARHLKVDPEDALRDANRKFVRRFRRMRNALGRRRKKEGRHTLGEMDRIWNRIK